VHQDNRDAKGRRPASRKEQRESRIRGTSGEAPALLDGIETEDAVMHGGSVDPVQRSNFILSDVANAT
jgi:hypothetical protein